MDDDRPVGHQGLADDVAPRHEAPPVRVVAVVAIIAQNKVLVVRNLDRFVDTNVFRQLGMAAMYGSCSWKKGQIYRRMAMTSYTK